MKMLIFNPQKNVLNVAAFKKNVLGAGPGNRDVIWLQGCHINCPSCANKDYIPHIKKKLMDITVLIRHFKNRQSCIDGISVSGGEPTEQAQALIPLLATIQDIGMTTVLYTGHTYEHLCQSDNHHIHDLLNYIDLLIDGPFISKKVDYRMDWRGSQNQRLIHLSKRLKPENQAQITGEIRLSNNTLMFNGCASIPLLNNIIQHMAADNE